MEIITFEDGIEHWIWVLMKGKKPIAKSYNTFTRRASAKRAAENVIRDIKSRYGKMKVTS
ncbi:MAG TPA: hypothetical protein ENI27_02285 [bacterium]|nr:hypothetical protein [bacterium]